MNDYTTINPDTWARKKQFDFFVDFDEPFFNVSANVKTGDIKQWARANGYSVNLTVLFVSQKVINTIPEFKMRIVDDEIRQYDFVHCGSTIFMPDQTFSFCYFDYTESLKVFNRIGKENIEKLKQNGDFDPRDELLNIIHYSTLPWISFNSIKHPRRFSFRDSFPKIVFGKFYQQNNDTFLPVSVEAHHALVDGYHMGLYLNGLEKEFENLLDKSWIQE